MRCHEVVQQHVDQPVNLGVGQRNPLFWQGTAVASVSVGIVIQVLSAALRAKQELKIRLRHEKSPVAEILFLIHWNLIDADVLWKNRL